MVPIPDLIAGALAEIGLQETGKALLDKARRKKAMQVRREWQDRYIGKLMRRGAELERRVANVEEAQQRIQNTLEDPDFWDTFIEATEAAGRTGDETKHEVLARAVIERLAAYPESMAALASRSAVEVLPGLSSNHLNALGTAALVYAVRPSLKVPEYPDHVESVEKANKSFQDELNTQANLYSKWLAKALGKAPVPTESPSEVDTAHLISSSVLTYHSDEHRDLLKTLDPWRGESRFTSLHALRPLHDLLESQEAGGLKALWRDWLQHVTLTPSGVVLGTAVIDFRCGESTALNFDSLQNMSAGSIPAPQVWDDFGSNRLHDDFLDALERSIKNLFSRGGGHFWKSLGKRW